jgi:hypothetical protein
MLKFAFISRHAPTQEQHELAAKKGVQLICVGDDDAFSIVPNVYQEYDGVVVVHPAAALSLIGSKPVGVFKNEHRLGPNENVPKFRAADFVVWDSYESVTGSM